MTTLQTDNPYPGLRPFSKNEAHLFFGRETQVDAIVDKLSAARFVAVVGTSGSGKTSLVNCGLRPALCRGLMTSAGSSWKIVQFRPGGYVIDALATAISIPGAIYSGYDEVIPLKEFVDTSLRISKRGLVDVFAHARLPAGTNVLLVVDQYEELFRYRGLGMAQSDAPVRKQEAAAFVELLLEARRQTAVPVYIAITMRSDFLGDAAEFPGLPEAINEGQYLVPRMTREELRSAILRPARVGGAEISPVLLTRLVNDVGDNPDQLSILQHALNRTWEHWRERGGTGLIELPEYDEIGMMAEALDRHAERAYEGLANDSLRLRCERVFKMLTNRGTDSRGIRRPLEFGRLRKLASCSTEELTEALRIFREPAQSFLMPPEGEPLADKTVIDISHESLMRVWERLKRWVDEESLSAQQYVRLADAARRRPATALWGDPDLPLALKWRQKEVPTDDWASLYGGGYEAAFEFLADSEAVYAEALQDRKRREEQELNSAKKAAEDERLRAEDQARLADIERLRAEDQARLADIERLRAEDQARLADIERLRAEDQTRNANVERLRAQDQAQAAGRLRWVVGAVVVCLVAAVFLWRHARVEEKRANIAKGEALALNDRFLGALKEAQNAEFGESLAQGKADIAFQEAKQNLVKAQTEKRRAEAETRKAEHEARRNASHELAQFSADTRLGPDLRLLLALRAVSLFYESGEEVEPEAQDALERELQNSEAVRATQLASGHIREIRSVAVSPVDEHVATGSIDGTTRVWDAASGLPLLTLIGQPGGVFAVAFSPDGRLLATGGEGMVIDIWEVSSGRHLRSLYGHTKAIMALAFAPDGRLISGSLDSTARVWEMVSPQGASLVFSGHTDSVWSVAADPDGKHFATVSKDGSARLWNLANPHELPGVVTWQSDDSTPQYFPLGFMQNSFMATVSFSPEGRKMAIGGNDQNIKIWDTADLKAQPRLLKYAARSLTAIAYSPDGKHIAVGGGAERSPLPSSASSQPYVAKIRDLTDPDDKTLTLYTTNTVNSFNGYVPTTLSLAFSHDGRRVVGSSSSDSRARIWDPATAQDVTELADSSVYETAVAVTKDGGLIAATGSDGSIRLFDGRSGLERYTLGRTDDASEPTSALSRLVRAAAFCQSGRFLAELDEDGTTRIWDTSSGKEVHRTNTGTNLSAVALSDDGAQLATIHGKTLQLQDSSTSAVIKVLTTSYAGSTPRVAFSPDGHSLAATTAERAVTLWNLGTMQQLVLHQQDSVDAFAFRPNSLRLAIAARNGSTTLWDTTTGHASGRTMATGIVSMLAFDPSGTNVAALTHDNSLTVWTADAGTRIFSLPNVPSPAQITFRPDGNLVVVSRDLFLQRYPLHAPELVAAAQQRVTRSLTPMECLRFLHGPCSEEDSMALALIADGNQLLKNGDSAAARAKYAQAAADSHLHIDAAEDFRQLDVELLLAQGRSLAWKGDPAGSASAFQQARQLDTSLVFNAANAARHLAASAALAKGRNLARGGNRSAAVASFQLANQQDSGIHLDPENEVDKLLAQSAVAKGVALAELGNPKAAQDQFNTAAKLDPTPDTLRADRIKAVLQDAVDNLANAMNAKASELIDQQHFSEAYATLLQAAAVYTSFPQLDPRVFQTASRLNSLCWRGSLARQPAQVMSACNQAVAYTNGNAAGYRDSRGLALALTGDKTGAIQDFQYFANHTGNAEEKKQRLDWINALNDGGDPFTPDVLRSLVKQ